MCLEWFGDDPPPAPRWHSKCLDLSATEREYLYRAVRQRAEDREENGGEREAGFADPPYFPADRIRELSFSDLLHMLFGVAT